MAFQRGMGRLTAFPGAQEAIAQSTSGRGVQVATLHVSPANSAAVLLYTKAGFSESTVLEDYYAAGRPGLKLSMQLRN